MESMSSLDVAISVSELNEMLTDGRIRNVYQIGRIFLFKIRVKGENLHLLVEPGRRIHLTWYERAKPRLPPQFCMVLRKHLKHGRILSVRQHDFDRVVVLNVGFDESKVSLVFELFGEGNVILLDSDGKIVVAETYASMRDRDVLPKKDYLFPPSRGKDPRSLSFEEFKEALARSKGKVASVLVRNFSISGVLAEEACLRSGIDKYREIDSLSEEELSFLFEGLTGLIKEAFERGSKPGILFRNGEAVMVSPVKLKMYNGEGFRWEFFESFNKAADEFYSRREEVIVKEEKKEELRREESKIQKMLDAQRETLEKAKKVEEEYRRYGDLLYKNFHFVSQLLEAIVLARKKDYSWEEIEARINAVRDRDPAARIFAGVKPHEGRILVELDGEIIPLDMKLSAAENANRFYEKAKKAAAKAERVKKLIEETLRKMEEAKEKEEKISFMLRPKRRKKWYEAYRWMISSDGLLVLGGKDAKSNIALYKRMEPKDVFFHAEVHGAPVVIVKTEGKPCPEATLREAAQFAVSYSRAWREGLAQADAYWVHPDQVSESPPSGEYLPKGGLIIRGKRNYFRNVPLELAVGVTNENDELIVIAGPPSAVAKRAHVFVKIKPGKTHSSKLAESIKNMLAEKAPKDLAKDILKIPLDEIQSILPPGGGEIVD